MRTRGNLSRRTLGLLRRFESRNVTYLAPDGRWPIVWERARGVHVWDAEGRRYVDLTSAFGVAAAGHGNAEVLRAGRRQMGRLLHGMGDVHPHALKAALARELSRITFERWTGPGTGVSSLERGARSGKTVFCNSGFEAVEAGLKTALLATRRPGIVAFDGAYHGLGYGALSATHREFFRSPFRPQLAEFGCFAPYPVRAVELEPALHRVGQILRRGGVGAVLVEPVQGRGGIRVPVRGFLAGLRRLCDRHGVLLILDEVYTGLGRTGRWFACEHERVVPDVICLGKALTGGFPLSACVGRADVMDEAWPVSRGEALHTSTFLGHPVGCAMALAQISAIRRGRLVERSARLGRSLLSLLRSVRVPRARGFVSARGMGLMTGLELCRADGSPDADTAFKVVQSMLDRGFILLPEGEAGNVIALTPPLTIDPGAIRAAVAALQAVLEEVTSP